MGADVAAPCGSARPCARVSLEPVPAITVAPSPTSSRTASSSAQLLVVGERRRLAGGPGDDEPVRAVVDQVAGERAGPRRGRRAPSASNGVTIAVSTPRISAIGLEYQRVHESLSRRRPAGVRSAHGCARSSWAATWISRSSRPNGATSWTPIGRPSSVQCSGSEIAGWPVALKSAVNAPAGTARRKASSGSAPRVVVGAERHAAARPSSASAAGRSRSRTSRRSPGRRAGGGRRRAGSGPLVALAPDPRPAPRSAARRRRRVSSRPSSIAELVRGVAAWPAAQRVRKRVLEVERLGARRVDRRGVLDLVAERLEQLRRRRGPRRRTRVRLEAGDRRLLEDPDPQRPARRSAPRCRGARAAGRRRGRRAPGPGPRRGSRRCRGPSA